MFALPSETLLGRDLQLLEVYESYDGPRLFLCRNQAGQVFLGISAEDSSERQTWLYVAISDERRQQLEGGAIDLQTAFTAPEDSFVYEAQRAATSGDFTVVTRHPQELTEDQIPMQDEYLRPVEGAAQASLEPVQRVATQRRRDTVRLALGFRDIPASEAPSRALGQVLTVLQELVAAAAQAVKGDATTRGRLPPDILRGSELRVVGTYAGSFGLELAAAQLADIFGDSMISDALNALAELLDAKSDREALRPLLEALKPRVASKYRSFMEALTETDASIHFEWGSVTQGRGSVLDLSRDDVRGIVKTLIDVGAALDTTYVVTGPLVALNARTRYFEIEDRAERRRVSGRLDPARFEDDQEFVVNAVYRATIRETVEVSGLTGDEKISRTLTELERST